MAFIELKVPTMPQVYAGLRYAGVAAGSVGSLIVFAGALPADTVNNLVTSFQQVMSDLDKLVHDSYIFFGFAIPAGTILLAKLGWNSARPQNQVASAQALDTVQVVTTDPKLAATVPGVKLVPNLNVEAKNG